MARVRMVVLAWPRRVIAASSGPVASRWVMPISTSPPSRTCPRAASSEVMEAVRLPIVASVVTPSSRQTNNSLKPRMPPLRSRQASRAAPLQPSPVTPGCPIR
jgi:hypothetical protein